MVFGKFIPVTTSIGYNFYAGHGDDNSTIDFNKRVSLLKEDSTFETEKSMIGFDEAFKYIKEHPYRDLYETSWKVFSL